MKVHVTPFWLPKAGNTQEEYEDALYPKYSGKRQGKLFCFAMADGASESMLSGKWAEILVKILCRLEAPDADAAGFLERSYKAYSSWKRTYLHDRERRNRPIQWFEEPGLQAGAFSTFLRLALIGSEGEPIGKWDAIAIGDTCLFHVRGGVLTATFPMDHSSHFSSRPFLISSDPHRNKGILDAVKTSGGDLRVYDRFYLMTDALASWFLAQHEVGEQPWEILCSLGIVNPRKCFTDWIADLRARRQIRNDDVTLIRIEII